jgi:hypothetical protein
VVSCVCVTGLPAYLVIQMRSIEPWRLISSKYKCNNRIADAKNDTNLLINREFTVKIETKTRILMAEEMGAVN